MKSHINTYIFHTKIHIMELTPTPTTDGLDILAILDTQDIIDASKDPLGDIENMVIEEI